MSRKVEAPQRKQVLRTRLLRRYKSDGARYIGVNSSFTDFVERRISDYKPKHTLNNVILFSSTTLIHLDLSSNHVRVEGAKALDEVIEENLVLSELRIGTSLPERVQRCLEENRNKEDQIHDIDSEALLALVLGRTTREALFRFRLFQRVDLIIPCLQSRKRSESKVCHFIVFRLARAPAKMYETQHAGGQLVRIIDGG